MLNQIIAVNKPIGPTSHDIIDQIRRSLPYGTKVGHAGTLDPLACGVLIIGIGPSTKLMNEVMGTEKVYLAEITLGSTSVTHDSEGPITNSKLQIEPSLYTVESILPKFVGEIDQVPPAYSAIKVAGRKSYRRARSGETVELPSRKVWVKSIDLVSYGYPKLTLQITTGKGVYIRSIARDIDQELGTGAYMSALTRTRVGKWGLKDSLTPEEAIADLVAQVAQQP